MRERLQLLHSDQSEGPGQATATQRRCVPRDALQGEGRQRLLVLLHLRRQQQHSEGGPCGRQSG